MRRILTAILFLNLLIFACALNADPAPVLNVVAKDKPNDGGGAIEISWDRSPSEDIVRHDIIRVTKTGKETVVGSKTQLDTYFLDGGSSENPLNNNITFTYIVRTIDSQGQKADSKQTKHVQAEASWFHTGRMANLFGVILFGALFFLIIVRGSKESNLYIRPIAALDAIDDAVGRAAEMGRPILYVPGLSDVSHPCTVASMGLLSKVGEKAVRLWTKIKVPNYNPLVWPVAQSVLKQSYIKAGRPDEYTADDVPYFTSRFLTFATAVAGIMVREKTASNFLIGHFYSEALILAETGASTGAVQIGGTDSEAQLPFFITTCDYTMIGEEVFAAAALISGDHISKASIKATDWFKLFAVALILLGVILSLAATAGSETSRIISEQFIEFLKGAR